MHHMRIYFFDFLLIKNTKKKKRMIIPIPKTILFREKRDFELELFEPWTVEVESETIVVESSISCSSILLLESINGSGSA